jgi:cytochrome c
MLLLLGLLLGWAGAAPAQDLSGHGGPVRALAVLATSPGTPPILASAGFDHAVILWDPQRGRALRVLRWHGGAVNALLALPDGGGLASAGEDGRIALWPSAASGMAEAPARVLEGHAAPVAGLAPAGQGAIASAGWDGTVRLWRPGAPPVVLEGHAGPVNAVAALPGATPEAPPRLVSAGHDGTLRLWEARGSGAAWEGRVLREFGTPQAALLALPGGGGLAAAGADGAIRLVGPDGAVRALEAGTRPVVALALAPDGATLAAASLGGSVTLWSLPEGRLRLTLQGPGQPFWSLAFSPDGRSLWTGGQDRRIRRWDVATGTPLGPLAGADTDAPAAAAAAARAEPQGARVWRACAACHALTAEPGPPIAGPHLHGLFGRRMGTVPGYAYSPRLSRGDITWTPETVADLFTRGPDVVVPGTKMPVQTVGEPGDLAALLRFLEAATR